MNEKRFIEIEGGIFYKKGQTAQIKLENYTRTFKVNKPFKLHGFDDKGRVVVTVPLSLATLKSLGFISKVK